jgi:hypothetical protein
MLELELLILSLDKNNLVVESQWSSISQLKPISLPYLHNIQKVYVGSEGAEHIIQYESTHNSTMKNK